MIRTFTQDDLIRYVYHETTEAESKEIEQAMLFDAELEARYNEINGIKKRLDSAEQTPSDRVIANILDYSKSLNLLPNK